MYIVIFVTASCMEEAEKISSKLIESKLAACVNMIDGVKSVFWWEQKVDIAREIMLIIKTKKSKLSAVIKLVKSIHSYEVPEIIALPVVGGEKKYLRWIDDSLRRSG